MSVGGAPSSTSTFFFHCQEKLAVIRKKRISIGFCCCIIYCTVLVWTTLAFRKRRRVSDERSKGGGKGARRWQWTKRWRCGDEAAKKGKSTTHSRFRLHFIRPALMSPSVGPNLHFDCERPTKELAGWLPLNPSETVFTEIKVGGRRRRKKEEPGWTGAKTMLFFYCFPALQA